MTRRALGIPCALLVAASLCPACGDVDAAGSPFAGTVVYSSPSGSYAFNFLSPPWGIVKRNGESVEMVVASSVGSAPSSPVYDLLVSPRPGSYMAAAESAEASVKSGGGVLLGAEPEDPTRTVRNARGDETGAELEWSDPATGLFHRQAYLAGPRPESSYEMDFSGRSRLGGDPFISSMIASFQVAPSTGGDVGQTP